MEFDNALQRQFSEEGFIGPIPVLSPEECKRALTLRNNGSGVFKGNAVANYGFYEIASRPGILQLVRTLIGENVLLWGARMIFRNAGSAHPWHTDIECCGDPGKSVNVWIGLDKTNEQTALQILSYSHRFGRTLQEVAYGEGKKRRDVTTEDVVRWAKQHHPAGRLVRMKMQDGEALLFDGDLWHYAQNTTQEETRVALLLQYATPEKLIRLPKEGKYEWPFRYSEEKPPCIMVSGSDRFGVNDIVAPPTLNPLWPNWIKNIESLRWFNKKPGWKSGNIFRGAIGSLHKFQCHVSSLEEGKTPHPPHQHAEEELLIVLSGRLEVTRVDENQHAATETLLRGSVVYHPAFQRHTVRSTGPNQATYLMFKWEGIPGNQNECLPSSTFHVSNGRKWNRPGFRQIRLFHQSTLYLHKLHSHFSVLNPGNGYPPHHDSYHVAILVLNGRLKTLNQEVGPGSVIFYHANELHGMENPGKTKASYLVFEFHE